MIDSRCRSCGRGACGSCRGHRGGSTLAAGLGASIALLCDIIVADEKAVIGDPHVKVGLAKKFLDYLTSAEAKKLIASYRRNGEQLFYVQ